MACTGHGVRFIVSNVVSQSLIPKFCSHHCYVMVKIFIQASSMGDQVDNELNIYKCMQQSPTGHRDRDVIRTLLDTFYIDGPEGKHRCLVRPPLWESVLAFLRRNPVERLPSPVIALVLHRLFLALDYLHTECHIAHTGSLPFYLPGLRISSLLSIRHQSRQHHVRD